MLHRAIWLKANLQVQCEKSCRYRKKENKFQVVANQKNSGKETSENCVKEEAYQQALLIIVSKRASVEHGPAAFSNFPVLSKSFERHEKGTKHPISNKERDWRKNIGNKDKPAKQKTNRVVHGFANNIQVGKLFCSKRLYVVRKPHYPKGQSGETNAIVYGESSKNTQC